MSGRSTYYEAGPRERFGIVTGDDFNFDVVPERHLETHAPRFPSRLAAVESYLGQLEVVRGGLARAIAKAKRLRRAWKPPAGEVGHE